MLFARAIPCAFMPTMTTGCRGPCRDRIDGASMRTAMWAATSPTGATHNQTSRMAAEKWCSERLAYPPSNSRPAIHIQDRTTFTTIFQTGVPSREMPGNVRANTTRERIR
jgi:hypothetical protein